MKFSVLLPTRNRLELLKLAIETVRRQDYQDWEVVVSDNASQENVRGFIESLADDRIVYVRSEKLIPVTENWNLALSHCTGDYIIMLGDDDGLLPGYFRRVQKLIQAYQYPEVLYTAALLYAYPGVLPDVPLGFLKSYEYRSIFQGGKEPFLLHKGDAQNYVDASLDFRVEYDYNMQFFLVSRFAVERLQRHGAFYQSPYPDYYAANALLHLSPTILVVPTPMVVIGISPKSFGFYYFNNKESVGTAFLNNMEGQSETMHLDGIILPGTDMNTCWLMAMETFGIRFGRAVHYRRYRELQIRAVLASVLCRDKGSDGALAVLHNKATLRERLQFLWPFCMLNCIVPKRCRLWLANKVLSGARSHENTPMPLIRGQFKNMLEVFDQALLKEGLPH